MTKLTAFQGDESTERVETIALRLTSASMPRQAQDHEQLILGLEVAITAYLAPRVLLEYDLLCSGPVPVAALVSAGARGARLLSAGEKLSLDLCDGNSDEGAVDWCLAVRVRHADASCADVVPFRRKTQMPPAVTAGMFRVYSPASEHIQLAFALPKSVPIEIGPIHSVVATQMEMFPDGAGLPAFFQAVIDQKPAHLQARAVNVFYCPKRNALLSPMWRPQVWGTMGRIQNASAQCDWATMHRVCYMYLDCLVDLLGLPTLWFTPNRGMALTLTEVLNCDPLNTLDRHTLLLRSPSAHELSSANTGTIHVQAYRPSDNLMDLHYVVRHQSETASTHLATYVLLSEPGARKAMHAIERRARTLGLAMQLERKIGQPSPEELDLGTRPQLLRPA